MPYKNIIVSTPYMPTKLDRVKKLFKVDDHKSRTVARNIFFSFFIKALNISVNFLTIPLVLTFLDTTQYGVWLTLTAILGWFSLFDLGFGNGLRNHLTIAVANKDFTEGKIYVSTTYAALSVIFGTLILVFLCANPFINWVRVFNAPAYMAHDINIAVLFAMCFLFVQFVVRLINTVLLSFQRAAMADFTNALVQVFILIGLYAVKVMGYKSLTSVAIVYSLTPIVVFLVFTLFLFFKTYAAIRPSVSFVKTSYVNKLLKLGLNFFIIQIAALVLYASDNFIITQFFSPSTVTTYNISFKYFSIVNIFFTIALAPFWSMTTKSYQEGDIGWIRKAINKLLLIWLLLSLAELLQLFISNFAYKFWTHNTIVVPMGLSVTMCIYFVIMNWGLIFGNFLNGVGKIRLMQYFSIIGMIINIPLAIVFIKLFHFGIIGIPIATILTMVGGNLLATIQYSKIINNRSAGFWDK